MKELFKEPKISKGYVRSYVKCRECGTPAYRDYVPYSLSNPILVLPCNHYPFKDFAIGISRDDFVAAINQKKALEEFAI